MSDKRYRALERAAKSGDIEALLKLAHEKVRIGEEGETFLERALALAEELPKLPNYYDPDGSIAARELPKRVALLQSYILEEGEIRNNKSRYNPMDILDLITIESAMDSSETASGEFTDYSYSRVDMAGGAVEAFGYNDSSMSYEVENYFGVAPAPLTREEIDFLWNKVGAIVYFASDGSRDLQYFDVQGELNFVWEEIQAEFDEVIEEDDTGLTLDGEQLED